MAKKQKLVLFDGLALFYRAYYAIPHLTNKDGLPTNAVYGFIQMVLKAYADLKPDFVILAWDKAKTSGAQRTALYPEYKSKRVKMPDEFYGQMPLVREFAAALGLPFVEADNYEADDIIGTFVKQADPSLEIIVVTNDRDTFQLLDNHPDVKIYMQRRGMTDTVLMDTAGVKEKYGIEPDQIIDMKAIGGDASDNIPGVPGIGEKGAQNLLAAYKSLDGVYANLEEIKGAMQTKLQAGKDSAYLSYKLATILDDAPVKLDLETAKTGSYDRPALHELFMRLGFKSLLARLPVEMDVGTDEPTLFDMEAARPQKIRSHINKAKYECVNTAQKLDALVSKLEKIEAFAFDTETDSVDIMTANLVGMAVSFAEGEAYYIPVGHQTGTQLKLQDTAAKLKPLLENPKIAKVGHNIKFDYQVMRRHGVTINPVSFDTMIAAFVVNPLGRSQTLGDLAYSELGIEMIPIEDLIGKKGKNQMSFDVATVEDATRYAAEDADVSWRLYRSLEPQLGEQFGGLVNDIEFPLIPVLAEMELTGIELDSGFLKEFNKNLSARIIKLEEEIWQQAGESFNIGSPAQLGQILFGKLGLTAPGARRGKTGSLSTAARELDKMRGQHPIIELIFEHRELVKLKNTYVDALPELVGPDGRLHTSFNQTTAQTGRLSSTNPNLQNIPIRTDLGREIRKAFVAPKGRVLVSGDYSQIELRVAAALSKDEAMIETFRKGIDLHQQTAAEMYGVPLDQVTKQMRYNAKTINFGVLYGMSAHGLSVATGQSREEAAGFIKRYYEVRPRLAQYITELKEFARTNEYTETLFGRRRPCPEINSNNFVIANAAERYAVNVPIQGTAADIMKLAMIALSKELQEPTKMLLQIHDELIIETDEKQAEATANQMKRVMEGVYDLGVPIAVDTAVGKTWGELG